MSGLKVMTSTALRGGVLAAGMAAAAVGTAQAQSGESVWVGMGDVPSIESLGLLIALERAEENGVETEMTFFNAEDVATQAVLGGQADIGVGAPYAFIENSDAPIRMFFRMSKLLFFPVVDTQEYQDWQDLDGEEVVVHSRGSGTEALMRMMEDVHDIEYSNMSYVPGSEVRAGAMLDDNIEATIVDEANYNFLKEEGGDRFQRLPLGEVSATDEALYARQDFLENRQEDVRILVEQLLRTWEDLKENPELAVELRNEYNLLSDLGEGADADIRSFYQQAAESNLFPTGGGDPSIVQNDLQFLSAAGQVPEPSGDVDVSQYWDFGPLNAVTDN